MSSELGTPESIRIDHPSAPKGKRNLLIGFGAIAVIGLTVGLAVGLTQGGGNDDAPPAKAVAVKPQFARTSSFINEICSKVERRDLVELGDTGKDIVDAVCEEECEVAKCCDPLSSDESCIGSDTSLASCIAYAKCQKKEDPAPLNLPEICSVEQLAVDSSACETACAPANCCSADMEDDRCLLDKFMMCIDYAPCQNLRKEKKVTVAPSNLDEICKDGGDDCKNICDAASCCADDPVNGDNCFQTDFISCASHAACGFLLLDIPNNKVATPAVKSELEAKCNPTVLTSGSRDQCVDACAPAECCTASGSNIMNNCFMTDPFGCLDYKRCSYLSATGGSVPVAPDNISEVCTLNNIINNDSKACSDICQTPEASCCYEWAPSKNCVADGNAYACSTYYPCASLIASLIDTDGSLESPDPSISVKCSSSAIEADDSDCKDLCEPASCCKSMDDNCFFENAKVCTEYGAYCANLLTPRGEVKAPTPPEDLSEICPLGSSFLGGKSDECDDVCETASCCKKIGEGSCALNSSTECAEWLLYCI